MESPLPPPPPPPLRVGGKDAWNTKSMPWVQLKKNTLVSCYEPTEDIKEKLFKSLILSKNRNIKPLYQQNTLQTNRQKLGKIFIPNGAIYIFRITNNFLKTYINFKSSISYIMRENEVIDINNKKDYEKAKKLIK